MSIAIPGRRVLLFTEDYLTALRRTEPDRIVGLWLGNEASGATAFDRGPGAHHGTYAGVTPGGPGPINGLAAPFYDGSTGYLNVYSESLAVGRGTVNLVLNPSAETTGNYVGVNVTVTRIATDAVYGNYAYRCINTPSAFDYLELATGTTINGQVYTLSAWIKHVSGSTLCAFALYNGQSVIRQPVTLIADGQWHRYSVTVTWTGATGANKFLIYLGFTGDTALAATYLIDGAQVEQLGYATAYEGYPGFLGSEGTALCWARVANADVWTDGATRAMLDIRADDANAVRLYKSTANNTLVASYTANAVAKECSMGSLSVTDWFPLALTWSASAGEVRAYLNGVQQGDTLTGLGSWLGKVAADRSIIGAETKAPLSPWHGWIGPCVLWNRALAPAAIARLSRRG
jgi:hypothetical protein